MKEQGSQDIRIQKILGNDCSRGPHWHEKALQETERRFCSGQEKIIDWKDVKKGLWSGRLWEKK